MLPKISGRKTGYYFIKDTAIDIKGNGFIYVCVKQGSVKRKTACPVRW